VADLGMRNCRLNYLGGGRWIVAYQIITGPETARTLSIPLTFEEAQVIAKGFCDGLESVMQARENKGTSWQEKSDKKPTLATSISPGTPKTGVGKSEATSRTAKAKSSISDSAKSERSGCKTGSRSSRNNSAQRSTVKGSKGKGGKATTKAAAVVTDKEIVK
jgi:hypothetical protein